MRVLTLILFGFIISSCNPYEPYPMTHYYIQAEIDPGSARISANVQIVFIPQKEYRDSICFYLNSGFEILSLTAQELKYYEFMTKDTGLLVLYIQEVIRPGEQMQIATSYRGNLDSGVTNESQSRKIDSSHFWYPLNEDFAPFTAQVKFSLPGGWTINHPQTSIGKHGKRLFESRQPLNALNIIFTSQ